MVLLVTQHQIAMEKMVVLVEEEVVETQRLIMADLVTLQIHHLVKEIMVVLVLVILLIIPQEVVGVLVQLVVMPQLLLEEMEVQVQLLQ